MKRLALAASLLAFLLSLPLLAATKPAAPVFPATLKTYDSPYYTIHTDLDADATREAYIRMTRMFEEYKRRTAGFSGDSRGKLPFYLFKQESDYFAAGGPEDSAGVFIVDERGPRLMAVAGEKTTRMTWHIVQHEGFHQFAAAVIRGDLPPWVNEGLAEYFGEAVFTGDGFVTAVIPPGRLERVQTEIAEKKLKSFREMFLLSQKDWNDKMAMTNYDQAWAMVHFLAHAEDGKYQKPFVRFMNLLGNGKPYLEAWFEVFGRDVDAFQKRFEKWWTDLPENPTQVLYQRAALLQLTAILARAHAQGQDFETLKDFLTAIEDGTIKITKDDYLPPALITAAGKQAKYLEELALTSEKGQLPHLSCLAADGAQLITTFTLANGRVHSVTCESKPNPIRIAPAPPAR
jgi:hypothetical protein